MRPVHTIAQFRLAEPGSPATLSAWFGRMCIVCALSMSFLWAVPLRAQQQTVAPTVILPERECQLKYAYLYSFGLLVTWPDSAFADAGSPFVISVLGEKPFGELLDHLSRIKTIRGRRIEIRHMRKADEYQPSHILFVTESASAKERDAVLKATAPQPVLVVGEDDGFEQSGAVANFYFANDSIRFFLNLDEAERHKLALSAQLSRIATVVRDRTDTTPTNVAGP